MARHTTWILVLAGAVSLCACETVEPDPQLVASPDKVTLMLAESADRASGALETLAAIEQARTPQPAVSPIDNAPPELRRAMTISWVGPAEQLLKKLANRASYNFMTIGNAPPVPLVVSIDVENRPVIDIMRDVGLQLGARSDVSVNAKNKMVELHYSPANTPAGR